MARVWGLVVRPVVFILAVSVPAAGCSNACTAIGWVNAVTVELDGDLSQVSTVQLCDGAECSELSPGAATTAPRTMAPLASLNPTARATPDVQRTQAPFYAEQVDNNTWRFMVNMSTPDHVTAKALSATGDILAEQSADLDWKRTGGSAQCGGPSGASPVRLTVPAA